MDPVFNLKQCTTSCYLGTLDTSNLELVFTCTDAQPCNIFCQVLLVSQEYVY